jgi:hypothetical protein
MTQQVEKVSGERKTGRIGGASIAWVTLFGALIGVTSLIPIFPYVGGGGYVPLATPFAAIAPLLLGPWGGIVAAIIGGVIGMFIAPGAYPLQLIDVIIGAALPALLTALMIHGNRFWKITVPLFVLIGIAGWLVPFYLPGEAGGFGRVPEPVYFLLTALYWIPSTIIALSPLGTRLIPKWVTEKKRTTRYAGIFLAILVALFVWWIPWTRPYWYAFNYTPEVGVATSIGYSWWIPAFSAITAIITVPIIEALERSGLPKIEGAIW